MEFAPANDRGFFIGKFIDRYGAECSLQESSIMAEEGYVWFGINEPELKHFCAETQWTDINLRDFYPHGDILQSGRMHLSQTNVEDLLPALMYFVGHGALPDEKYDETKQKMDGYRENIRLLRESV